MNLNIISLRCVAALIAVASIAFDDARAAPPIEGRASVVDGDTLDIGRHRVRIIGVDAPELAQSCTDAAGRSWSCGRRAQSALRSWLARTTVRCVPAYADRSGRPVAHCSAHGRDIGSWLVENGWALDYARYSQGAHRAAERSARQARRGVWAGHVTPPWEWRAMRENQRQQSSGAAPNSRCPYKGNINTNGQRIVHAPGQRDYAAVRIDTARGERWFCSLEQARRAGWRPASR